MRVCTFGRFSFPTTGGADRLSFGIGSYDKFASSSSPLNLQTDRQTDTHAYTHTHSLSLSLYLSLSLSLSLSLPLSHV